MLHTGDDDLASRCEGGDREVIGVAGSEAVDLESSGTRTSIEDLHIPGSLERVHLLVPHNVA